MACSVSLLCFHKLILCCLMFFQYCYRNIFLNYNSNSFKNPTSVEFIHRLEPSLSFCSFPLFSSFQMNVCIFCFIPKHLTIHMQIYCLMLSFPEDRLVLHTELEAFFLSTGQMHTSI